MLTCRNESFELQQSTDFDVVTSSVAEGTIRKGFRPSLLRRQQPGSNPTLSCTTRWDGYIGVGFESLHDEIMLCKPREFLTLHRDLKHSTDFLNDLVNLPTKEQAEAIIVEY